MPTMIRRPDAQYWILTTQNDHAIFAGQLAAHFGNEVFDVPVRRDLLITAITLHDSGWPLHDDNPTLDASGQPLHVFETSLAQVVRIWSASVDRAAEHGPYVGLLVSLHQFALSDLARQHIAGHPDALRMQFESNKFQQKQIERQQQFRQELGLRTDIPLHLGLAAAGTSLAEDALRHHFRLLTLADRLSLQLCCGKMLFSEIDDVIPRVGEEPVTITTRYIDDNEMTVDPWPFDQKQIRVEVPSRCITAETFPGVEEFRADFSATPVEPITYVLRSM